jgi:hypothetical protein
MATFSENCKAAQRSAMRRPILDDDRLTYGVLARRLVIAA